MDYKIEPRPPGLWMFQNGEITEDSAEVDKARAHLLQLLQDPYYAEAFQRLKREKHLSVMDRSGLLPYVKGALAAKYQSPPAPYKKGLPGRPTIEREWATNWVEAIERQKKQGRKRSLRKWCELIVRKEYPSRTKTEQELLSKWIYQIFLDQRKKLRKGKSI